MDTATARTRLQHMTQWDQAPILSAAEIDELLTLGRVMDPDGNLPLPSWAAASYYPIGAVRVPSVMNGHVYRSTVAGTSGAVEPLWPTATAATIVDGGVTWQEYGLYAWTPTYALRYAAAEGWRWKAGKLVNQYNVGTGVGMTFTRDQMYQHCMAQAAEYSKSIGPTSLRLTHGQEEQRELESGFRAWPGGIAPWQRA